MGVFGIVRSIYASRNRELASGPMVRRLVAGASRIRTTGLAEGAGHPSGVRSRSRRCIRSSEPRRRSNGEMRPRCHERGPCFASFWPSEESDNAYSLPTPRTIPLSTQRASPNSVIGTIRLGSLLLTYPLALYPGSRALSRIWIWCKVSAPRTINCALGRNSCQRFVADSGRGSVAAHL